VWGGAGEREGKIRVVGGLWTDKGRGVRRLEREIGKWGKSKYFSDGK